MKKATATEKKRREGEGTRKITFRGENVEEDEEKEEEEGGGGGEIRRRRKREGEAEVG